MVKLTLSLVFTVAVFGYTCRLLKYLAAFITVGGNYFGYFTLTDDRITIPAKTCIHKKFIDIFKTAGSTVYHIFALTAAKNTTGNFHLVIIACQEMGRVIQHKRNLGIAERLALLRTCKNDILHFSATESFCTLLAQHPSYSIGNITLTAAVRSNNGSYPLMNLDNRFIGKGFKALQLYSFKVHFNHLLFFCIQRYYKTISAFLL